MTVLTLAGGYFLAFWFGAVPPRVSFFLALTLVGLAVVGSFAFVGYVGWLGLCVREPHPIRRLKAVSPWFISLNFLGRRIAPLVLAFVFVGCFGTFKTMIPQLNPFGWDTALSDLDRAVLGTDAWRISHAMIGAGGTRFLDVAYGLWSPVWALAILHFSLFARVDLQRQFFLSFFVVWLVLGVVLATLFSSVGPCFLELIGHPYAARYPIPLDYAPVQRMAQSYLASAYLGQSGQIASGLSAMPSVHVAVAALLVAAARHYGRVALAMALVFFVLTFLGSVHLGWHYVSDGIVGAAVALAIWRWFGPGRRSPFKWTVQRTSEERWG